MGNFTANAQAYAYLGALMQAVTKGRFKKGPTPRYTRIMIKKGPDAYSTSWIVNEDFSPFSLVLMTEEDVRRAFGFWRLSEVYPLVPLDRYNETDLEPRPYAFWDAQASSLAGKEAYSVLTYLWTPEHGWLVKDLSETKWMDKSGWETLASHLVKRALF